MGRGGCLMLWDGRRAPVTLLGGYLGAGKTTIVNHVLAHAGGRRIVVLVNDLGTVQVDAALVAQRHDDTIELANGCVCCSLADGFAVALEQLRERPEPPDHVLIELSGVAEPERVVPWTATAGFRLDGVVVAADADRIVERAADVRLAELVRRQLLAADLVVVTRTDLAVEPIDAWLGTWSDAAQVVARHGEVEVDVLLGPLRNEVAPRTTPSSAPVATVHRHDVASVPRLTPAALEDRLASLPRGIVRAKGAVLTEDGPRLVQCVGPRRQLQPWSGNADGGVVVISLDGEDLAAAVAVLESPPGGPA